MIDIKFEVLDGMPCTTKTFEINGKEALVTDFGKFICKPLSSGYGCESMTFKTDPRNKLMVMATYKISASEFYAIGSFLTSVFDFSKGCDWCE